MEAIQACARSVSAIGAGAASSSSTPRQSSARALVTRKQRKQHVSCRSLSSSSLRPFCWNALAVKVPQAESRSSKGFRGVVTMRSDTAAGGYASALAELAQSTNSLEAIHKDIESFRKVLRNPEVHEFLVSPVVVDEKKKSILKTLAEDAQFNAFTLNFLYVLIDKKRMNLINDVLKEFSTIYYDLTDTEVATVSSAVRIEKAQLALIAKKIQTLSGVKNVRIRNVIDTSLIAGFVVKYGKDGSRFVDMSVKGQLDRLAQQFEFAEKVGVL